MVSQGKVNINGQALNEYAYLAKDLYTSSGSFLPEGVEKMIPEGYYLPMGDNRPYSRDGREFGPIVREAIIGKAWLRYWPVNAIGFIPKQTYQ